MGTTIGKADIATNQSNHAAPGPPGVSPGPPPPPAGPVPTPYPYVAKSNDVKRGTTNGRSLKLGSARPLLVGATMKIVPPCNKPAIPIGIGDVVTAAKDMWAAVLSGEPDTRAEGKKFGVTGSSVSLNVLFAEQQVMQVRTKFLSAVDFDAKMKDGSLEAWVEENVSFWGDPVSATTGEVIDWDFDVSLPGPVPLVWQRHYCSTFRKEKTPLGKGGWTHAYDQWIGEEDGRTVWRTGSGRRVVLPAIEPHGSAFLRAKGVEIEAEGSGGYRVRDIHDGRVHVFAPLAEGGPAMLHAVTNAWGRGLELRYEKGRLAAIIDAAGRELRLGYDAKARIVSLDVWAAAAQWLTVTYTYADEGELAAVTDATGAITRYGYDGKHRLVEKQLADGPTFRYAYDVESDVCVRAWSDEGFHGVAFEHRPAERTLTVCKTPEPRAITYDAQRAVVSEATPDGSWSRVYERDEDGFVTAETNAAGETIARERDPRGHLVARTDAAGRTTRWEITGDRVTKEIDPGGRTTSYYYDARGGLAAVTMPSGLMVGIERDRAGRVSSAYVQDGRLVSFEHDEADNLTRRVDERGAVTAYAYDPLGRLVGRTDPDGQTVRVDNDAAGRPVTFHYADGTTERYAWDARNRVTRIEDRRGRAWKLAWTGTRSIAKITQPDGQAWSYEVDVMERLVTVTSPRAERYELRYDRAGRVREEATFDGARFARQYDRSGRVARVDLPGEGWLSYAYSAAGEVVEEDSPHGKRTFAWDESGRVTSAVLHDYDREVGVGFERDKVGRVVTEAQGARAVGFGYDKNGRLAERVLPDGLTTKYFYDLAGDLVGIDHAGRHVAIERDKVGRDVRRHHRRGAIDILRAFNPKSRTIDQWVAPRGGGDARPVVQRRWTYDAESRPVELHDARWGHNLYEYGPTDELLGVTGRFGARYAFDSAGALVGAASLAEDTIAPWKVRAGNVLLRSATHTYAYDEARRRTKKTPLGGGAPTEYRWDARSRLREVHLPSGVRVSFWYDAFGRRTLKVVSPPQRPLGELGLAPQKPRVVEYLWHGFVLAAEIDSERGTRVFVHDPSTMLPVLHVEGDHTFAYVTDPMGAPRELLDEAGRIAWAAAISPYGAILETYRDPAAREASTPLRHLGHYADEETGLLCTLHRYFDPETARWLSVDPLLLAAGGNLFGLAKSPTLAIDPFGLGHLDVAPYRDPNPGFERHEPLQNAWLRDQGLGGRRMSDMSLGNPTIGLTSAEHHKVHAIAEGLLNGRKPGDLSSDDLIDLHADAMKQAGIPQDKIDAVVAAAKAHAPKFICS